MIPNEALKIIQHTRFEGAFWNILNSTLQDTSKISVEFEKSVFVLIPKEKQPSPFDYRPITVLNTVSKLQEIITCFWILKTLFALTQKKQFLYPLNKTAINSNVGVLTKFGFLISSTIQYHRQKKISIFSVPLIWKKLMTRHQFTQLCTS